MIPVEFTAEHLEEQKFNPNCRDFFAPKILCIDAAQQSVAMPPDPSKPLDWGSGHYYDTTTGDQHPYWRDQPLLKPTKDLGSLYRDLEQWGFCLIEDALSATQLKAIRSRVDEQAKAENLRAWRITLLPCKLSGRSLKGSVGLLRTDPVVLKQGHSLRLLNDYATRMVLLQFSFQHCSSRLLPPGSTSRPVRFRRANTGGAAIERGLFA